MHKLVGRGATQLMSVWTTSVSRGLGWLFTAYAGADPGFFKRGGSILDLQGQEGGAGGGPILGPMLKSLHSVPTRAGPDPWTPPPPPASAAARVISRFGVVY